MTPVADVQARIRPRSKRALPSATAIGEQLEAYLIPDDIRADGEFDASTKRKRSLRIVSTIAALSIAIFLPALFIAHVPTQLWLLFTAAVVVTVVVVSWSSEAAALSCASR